MLYPLLIITSLVCVAPTVFAQQASSNPDQSEGYEIPMVSLIGEYQDGLEHLTETHPDLLLSVCGDDLDYAYEQWMDLLAAIEDYATSIEYDIRGLKAYMYVFWNADGTIEHLAFFPKPNSRNIAIAELRALFKSFIRQYRMPIAADTGFSHYASAAFPTFARPEYRAKKNDK